MHQARKRCKETRGLIRLVRPALGDTYAASTTGRGIEGTRYVVPAGGANAELDVFAGDLTGLVLVEVESDSDEDMTGFEPPAWFGPEVTDDNRYSNPSLAMSGPDA